MNIITQLEDASRASHSLCLLSVEKTNQVLLDISRIVTEKIPEILAENEKDLARMDESNPKYDRLKLSAKRIKEIATNMKNVADLPSPLHQIINEKSLSNGLNIRQVSVAFGLVGIIYEARPNVTFDVFALCFKSGNVCVLKGGSEAEFSNRAIVKVIKEVLAQHNLNTDVISLLPTNREATHQLLNARSYVDLLIPRGSQELINFVRENATIPVIETGAGICHTYVDEHADITKAIDIINNAKTRRPSVCNSLDCMLIHENKLDALLPICHKLQQSNVVIYADEKSYSILKKNYPKELLERACVESFGTEFLDYKMSIKTVSNIEEALKHISKYGSKHSEAIVSEDNQRLELFSKAIDAAVVYCNSSTAFTDGAEFGLGAEIGISTQKLHARGPMALKELTTYKWLVKGNGEVRL